MNLIHQVLLPTVKLQITEVHQFPQYPYEISTVGTSSDPPPAIYTLHTSLVNFETFHQFLMKRTPIWWITSNVFWWKGPPSSEFSNVFGEKDPHLVNLQMFMLKRTLIWWITANVYIEKDPHLMIVGIMGNSGVGVGI